MNEALQFFRDSSWQFFFGLLGILVAIVIFLRQRQYKGLAFELLLSSPLFSLGNSEKLREMGKLEVHLNGRPIKGLNLYAIRISNAGNTPIVPTDYVNPLQVRLPEGSSIIGFEAADARSEELRKDVERGFSNANAVIVQKGEVPVNSSATLGIHTVNLPSVLLNKKDWFTVQLVVEESAVTEPVLEGRIVGIDKIRRISTGSYLTISEIAIETLFGSIRVVGKPIKIPIRRKS